MANETIDPSRIIIVDQGGCSEGALAYLRGCGMIVIEKRIGREVRLLSDGRGSATAPLSLPAGVKPVVVCDDQMLPASEKKTLKDAGYELVIVASNTRIELLR